MASQETIKEASSRVQRLLKASSLELALTPGTTHSARYILDHYLDICKQSSTQPIIYIQKDIHGSHLHGPLLKPKESGVKQVVIPISNNALECRLDWNGFESSLDRYKRSEVRPLVMLTHASNVTGVIHPLEKMANAVREAFGDRAFIYADAAQTAVYGIADFDKLPVDAVALSPYKITFDQKRDHGLGMLLVRNKLNIPSDPELQAKFLTAAQDITTARIGYTDTVSPAMLQELVTMHDENLIVLYGPRTYTDKAAVFAFSDTQHGYRQAEMVSRLGDRKARIIGCYRCLPLLAGELLGLSQAEHDLNMQELTNPLNFPYKRERHLSNGKPNMLRFLTEPNNTMETVEHYREAIRYAANAVRHK